MGQSPGFERVGKVPSAFPEHGGQCTASDVTFRVRDSRPGCWVPEGQEEKGQERGYPGYTGLPPVRVGSWPVSSWNSSVLSSSLGGPQSSGSLGCQVCPSGFPTLGSALGKFPRTWEDWAACRSSGVSASPILRKRSLRGRGAGTAQIHTATHPNQLLAAHQLGAVDKLAASLSSVLPSGKWG